MRCRQCGSKRTRVTVTEHKAEETWRYCRCLECKVHFKTVERYDRGKPGPKLGSRQATKLQGSTNPASVLTEADVVNLRFMASRGVSNAALAVKFGVVPATVSRIIHCKMWTHV